MLLLMQILKKITLAYNFDLDYLSLITAGYSNSDLQELCRNAVMVPVREAIRKANLTRDKVDPKTLKIRPVCIDDFKGFVDDLYINQAEDVTMEPVD